MQVIWPIGETSVKWSGHKHQSHKLSIFDPSGGFGRFLSEGGRPHFWRFKMCRNMVETVRGSPQGSHDLIGSHDDHDDLMIISWWSHDSNDSRRVLSGFSAVKESKPSKTCRCDPSEVQLVGTCNIMQLVCEQGTAMVPMVPMVPVSNSSAICPLSCFTQPLKLVSKASPPKPVKVFWIPGGIL